MKQRLVGTLVLSSLALIVIPLLLDGEGVERPPLSATTPPAPEFDTTPLPDPVRPEILADSQTPAIDTAEPELTPELTTEVAVDAVPEETVAETDAPPAAESETAPTTEPVEDIAATPAAEPAEAPAQSTSAPALDASGLPEGWVVRLGAFRDRTNADALVTRLVAAGHKAYIRPVMSGDVALSGVFVGPVPTSNEASALQTELKSRFQINDAIVQRYDITQ
jgi:DedD protein